MTGGEDGDSVSPGRTPTSDDDRVSRDRSWLPPRFACVMAVGSVSVGKTCLLESLVNIPFKIDYIPTVETEYSRSFDYIDPVNLEVPYVSRSSGGGNNKNRNQKRATKTTQAVKVKLTFIDTSGLDEYVLMRVSHYEDVDMVMFVYDATKRSSLEDIQERYYWEVCEGKGGHPLKIPYVLVATKMDLFGKVGREGAHVTEEEGRSAAGKLGESGCWFVQTSAKSEEGIEDLRNHVLALTLKNESSWGQRFPSQVLRGNNSRKNKIKRKIHCLLQ